MADLRITRENARFQQWEALLTNRSKRHRAREFLVQGVRPITRAVEEGWTVRALLRAEDATSTWSEDLWASTSAERVVLSPALHARLSGKEDGAELVAVVEMPDDGLARLDDSVRPHGPVVVLDRPSSPGNIGTLARSADAFGASALVVTGHAADPYDPRAVRASTGSLFALTVLRVPGPGPVIEHAHARGHRIVGTDEQGTDLSSVDLRGRLVVVVGNETTGLSSGWRAACDDVASIPMVGTASSLNAAVAGSIVLHEALRQRG
ncbi:rRNA methyltransferase [Nocardioides flavus (ex Wang et al. 2016)]|uniref:rRNA methyltransferase n=1 Tax=Nocardioides flavus (ex Wang et al. 2016) TaxID=2058780 RepID=A0ABQ3HT38_9ACTN|nr:TrmH family RNA methyltransferase [Nocardioides flavus (ex Wang et al. 2016)]GHE18990.1 rRNA methyltransferase [Nocardioides flavus (ex Wang et al. 2016)]